MSPYNCSNSNGDLVRVLPIQTLGELIFDHRIDPQLFAPGAITLGKDQGWEQAVERHKEKCKQQARENMNLRPNEVVQEERKIERRNREYFQQTQPDNWNLYSVNANSKGALSLGLELAG